MGSHDTEAYVTILSVFGLSVFGLFLSVFVWQRSSPRPHKIDI